LKTTTVENRTFFFRKTVYKYFKLYKYVYTVSSNLPGKLGTAVVSRMDHSVPIPIYYYITSCSRHPFSHIAKTFLIRETLHTHTHTHTHTHQHMAIIWRTDLSVRGDGDTQTYILTVESISSRTHASARPPPPTVYNNNNNNGLSVTRLPLRPPPCRRSESFIFASRGITQAFSERLITAK